MNELPLHPAIVHLPLGLAVVVPFLAAAFLWAMKTGRLPEGAWITVVALQAVLVGSAIASMKTGEKEEDRAEKFASEQTIHEHEERAEKFTWTAGATLAAAALALILRRKVTIARGLAVASVVLMFVTGGLGLWTGHAGGRMVHDALDAGAPATAGIGGGWERAQGELAETDDD